MCDNSLWVDIVDLYLLPITVGVFCVILFTPSVQAIFSANPAIRVILNLFLIFAFVYVIDRLTVRFRESVGVCRQFL